jgi:aromatic-amino-acid transaminase
MRCMKKSVLQAVEMAPRDPILGVTEAFNADTNPNKVNLGVGVYCDDEGKVPVLESVRRAEQKLSEKPLSKNYLPIDGLKAYDVAVQELVFGAKSEALRAGRIVTVQTLGGTGGLKVGADLLRRINPEAQIWISDPSWENHRALFEYAGYKVNTYPYYHAPTHGVDFEGMMAALRALPEGSIAVLHACCHNPTGVDLSAEQWEDVIDAVNARGLVPFLDLAYQGFAEGIDADAGAVRRFTERCPAVFVSSSFSKSLSLYGERVGALSVVTQDADEAARTLSQLKRVIRTNYSNPPTHGGQAVAMVLTTPDLRALWERRAGRYARAHQDDAPPARGKNTRDPRRFRFQFRGAPARHVFLLGTVAGAGAAAARGIFGLRHRQRTHLRRRAQLAQHRLRCTLDCERSRLTLTIRGAASALFFPEQVFRPAADLGAHRRANAGAQYGGPYCSTRNCAARR